MGERHRPSRETIDFYPLPLVNLSVLAATEYADFFPGFKFVEGSLREEHVEGVRWDWINEIEGVGIPERLQVYAIVLQQSLKMVAGYGFLLEDRSERNTIIEPVETREDKLVLKRAGEDWRVRQVDFGWICDLCTLTSSSANWGPGQRLDPGVDLKERRRGKLVICDPQAVINALDSSLGSFRQHLVGTLLSQSKSPAEQLVMGQMLAAISFGVGGGVTDTGDFGYPNYINSEDKPLGLTEHSLNRRALLGAAAATQRLAASLPGTEGPIEVSMELFQAIEKVRAYVDYWF